MSLPTTPAYSSSSASEATLARGWNPVCYITYTRDTWVKLLQPLAAYSFDEAKLLCQESSDTWIAWVPDYGEVILHRSEFYC